MEIKALLLVLIGSVLHLGWNVLAKGARDKLAFIWISLLLPSLFGGYYVVSALLEGSISNIGLLCIFASSVIHALYFWSLTNAYKVSDLSYVYPYSRGIGAFFGVFGGVLLLSERPSLLGWVGIGLTLSALILEAAVVKRKKKKLNLRGFAFTFGTGLATASYLLVDKIGVMHVPSAAYVCVLQFGTAVFLCPALLKNRRIQKEWKISWKKPLYASFFLTSAYGVVLAAMEFSPVSYVVAARATGIIMSGIAGILFFRETVHFIRWFAIGLIALGVYCIGVA